MRMRHIVMWPAPRSTIFFRIISHTLHDFRKRKEDTQKKNVCFDFRYNFCVKHFLF